MTGHAALRVSGLVKRYGSFAAVDGVDLTVERGQAFGLLGPNGSGKTTTLSCALGLMLATEGETEVLGVPPERLYELQGRLACVFDTPSLLPGHTIAQNLAYQRRLRGPATPPGRGLSEARPPCETPGLRPLVRPEEAPLARRGALRRARPDRPRRAALGPRSDGRARHPAALR
jgi:ABC-type sugar transport system ATPase subunit